MRDDDRMLNLTDAQFGSGIVGVCDICGARQAVIVLKKERFKLCVLDFLNKSWIKTDKKPGVPAPLYRSERVTFDTGATSSGKAQAIVLSPTKAVKHPVVLLTPDTYGITTTLLDAGIRFAREGYEVLIPDIVKTDGRGATLHIALRSSAQLRGGVAVNSPSVANVLRLYGDALNYLRSREMVDPTKAALFGTSYGASLALALAAQDTRLAAVALAYPMPVRPRGPCEPHHRASSLPPGLGRPVVPKGLGAAHRRPVRDQDLLRVHRDPRGSPRLPRPGPAQVRGRPRGGRVDMGPLLPQAEPRSSAPEGARDASETCGRGPSGETLGSRPFRRPCGNGPHCDGNSQVIRAVPRHRPRPCREFRGIVCGVSVSGPYGPQVPRRPDLTRLGRTQL